MLPVVASPCRVLIVTTEFHGLFKNGGLGTANTGLALALREAGHDVTVAYVGLSQDRDEAQSYWQKRGLRIDFPLQDTYCNGDLAAVSFAVLHYIRARNFDLIFFNECGGQGYYTLLAKRAGLLPSAPRMIVVTHGACAWTFDMNAELRSNLDCLRVDYLEQRSIALADSVISPSHYLLQWMQSHGWLVPEDTHIIPNIIPDIRLVSPRPDSSSFDELVFFGRLERRKGIDLFLTAYDDLCQRRDMRKIKVTFLGKFARIQSLHSGVYLLERTSHWPIAPTFLTDWGQEEALDYIRQAGRLAVIPSLAENSPCTVAECLIAHIPFIATHSGGTAELIAPQDRDRVLCDPTPKALADKVATALDHGLAPATLATPQEETKRAWIALVDKAQPYAVPQPQFAPVSLCLAESLSATAWESVLVQNFAEILVATEAELPPDPRIRRLRPCKDRAEARNLAAQEAKGPWLLFMEEQYVILKPQALQRFLTTAHTLQAQIVTCPALAKLQHTGWDHCLAHLPLGAHLPLAAFENCLGESCFLIDRQVFWNQGGFVSGKNPSLRDRLFLTQAVLAGVRLEVAPEALFWQYDKPDYEAVRDQREIINLFKTLPLKDFAEALEIVSAPATRRRAHNVLIHVTPEAQGLALRLSDMPQRDSEEQASAFIDYALLRNRRQEALAFAAGLKNPALLASTRQRIEEAAKKDALTAIQTPTLPATHSLPLLPIAAERVLAIQGLDQQDITHPDGQLAHPAHADLNILKVARLLPPHARQLRAKVETEAAVALCVCDPFAQISLDNIAWQQAPDIILSLPPRSYVADVFLFVKGPARAPVLWHRLEAEISLFDFSTPSTCLPGQISLPRHVLQNAQRLTPAPDFPAPYFQAGPPSLHHPLVNRPALVRIPTAVFVGATGVSATFGVEHAQSRPVEFALWVTPTRPALTSIDDLSTAAPHFSGWHSVRQAFRDHHITLPFPAPLTTAHDLYLATRVTEFPDNIYCHAVWRDIRILER